MSHNTHIHAQDQLSQWQRPLVIDFAREKIEVSFHDHTLVSLDEQEKNAYTTVVTSTFWNVFVDGEPPSHYHCFQIQNFYTFLEINFRNKRTRKVPTYSFQYRLNSQSFSAVDRSKSSYHVELQIAVANLEHSEYPCLLLHLSPGH